MNYWVWYLKNRTHWIVDFSLFRITLIEHFALFPSYEIQHFEPFSPEKAIKATFAFRGNEKAVQVTSNPAFAVYARWTLSLLAIAARAVDSKPSNPRERSVFVPSAGGKTMARKTTTPPTSASPSMASSASKRPAITTPNAAQPIPVSSATCASPGTPNSNVPITVLLPTAHPRPGLTLPANPLNMKGDIPPATWSCFRLKRQPKAAV